jgi:pyruvate dehydrogenase E1 component alpha subunit/2-oxoisovalerate dehydrogenase E1 component alpha subunit
LRRGWADAGTIAAWRAEATHEIEETVATVQREGGPDPFQEDWCALASRHLREGNEAG